MRSHLFWREGGTSQVDLPFHFRSERAPLSVRRVVGQRGKQERDEATDTRGVLGGAGTFEWLIPDARRTRALARVASAPSRAHSISPRHGGVPAGLQPAPSSDTGFSPWGGASRGAFLPQQASAWLLGQRIHPNYATEIRPPPGVALTRRLQQGIISREQQNGIVSSNAFAVAS